jgi:hypothetical protein
MRPKMRPPTASDCEHPGTVNASPQARMGGQGQDRTADLPLFRRTLIPTELPDRDGPAENHAPGFPAPTRAVLTGFEPATSTLTGWRALRAALQDPVLPTGHRAARQDLAHYLPPGPKEHITGMLVVQAAFWPEPSAAQTRDPQARVRGHPTCGDDGHVGK